MGIGVARPRQKEEPRYAIYGSVLAELESATSRTVVLLMACGGRRRECRTTEEMCVEMFPTIGRCRQVVRRKIGTWT